MEVRLPGAPLDPQLYIFTGRNEVVAKVMFLLVSVNLSTGEGGVCLSACWDATPGADTLQEQTSPGADTPWSRHPLEQTPPRADTPQSRHPPKQTPLGSRHQPPRADTPPGSRHHTRKQTPPRSDNPWEQTPPRSRHPPGADTPRFHHTVNERPVHILLECILVHILIFILSIKIHLNKEDMTEFGIDIYNF